MKGFKTLDLLIPKNALFFAAQKGVCPLFYIITPFFHRLSPYVEPGRTASRASRDHMSSGVTRILIKRVLKFVSKEAMKK